MSNEYVSADPSTFVDRGFLTGRPVTLGGVRASIRPLKNAESSRVGMQFFFTETGRDGEKRIISGFMHDGAWSDQMKPSENKRGLIPESGADRPYVEKNSSLGLFNAALKSAGCPATLQTGDYRKLVGMEVILEERTLPSFRRKKSVDPDEQAAPQREFKTEVVAKIINLPADNADYVPLTEKEMTAHLKEKDDKRAARQSAAAADPDLEAAVDEIEEEVAPKKKAAKKAAKPAADEEEEEESDSFGADEEEEEEEAAEEEEAEEEEEEDPAATLAGSLILQVLKKKKKLKASELLQQVHPLLAGKDKKTTAAVLKLAQSPKFIGALEGVTVKGSVVSLS